MVATPIGNLGDLQLRALATCCQSVTLIAAEDTRHTGALLQSISASKHRWCRCTITTNCERTPELICECSSGASIALVSDAGTPGISDPGFDLVRAAAAAGIDIVAVPGPCAAVAALSIAALPTDRFCFEGFLPARRAARRARLDELAAEPRTLVFYESPHRVHEMLEDCASEPRA